MSLTALLTAIALAFSQSAETPAEPQAPLEKLYDQLSAAESAAAANRLAGQIRLVWTDSGSDTVNLLMDRAEAAMEAGDADRAARHLDDALSLEPDFAEAWNRRAMLYLAGGEAAQALEAVNKALIADPKHFGALVGLGTILERLNRNEAAYEAYGEALEIHPFHEEATTRRERLAPLVEGRAL